MWRLVVVAVLTAGCAANVAGPTETPVETSASVPEKRQLSYPAGFLTRKTVGRSYNCFSCHEAVPEIVPSD